MHTLFNFFLWVLPKKLAHKILYFKILKKKLNLKNPVTLNEKIHWLILNYYGPKEGFLTDKYLVKEYIRKLNIKDLNILKTYFVFNDEKVDIKKFPKKFILKTNHMSGKAFACRDKKTFDFDNNIDELRKLLKKNFAKKLLEYHYSYIKPVIMCEELLEDGQREFPLDYKFYAFDGHVECVAVYSGAFDNLFIDFYDKSWNYLDYIKEDYQGKQKIERPKNLERMFEIASEISKGFPFVRVDLYNVNGKIYFSELTFTSGAGLRDYYTKEAENHLGSLIMIEDLTKKN